MSIAPPKKAVLVHYKYAISHQDENDFLTVFIDYLHTRQHIFIQIKTGLPGLIQY